MTIHVLVEGASERALLSRWANRLLPAEEIRIHPHQGKGAIRRPIDLPPNLRLRGLLDQLPAKLRGFAASLDRQRDSILILVDADDENINDLSASIATVAKECAPALRVEISVATEETEAFYLGDLRAVAAAYPGADMKAAREYTPDSICGTWELFGEIIGDGGGNKVAWAETMGPLLTTVSSQSRSPSFRQMIQRFHSLVQLPPPVKKRRFRHVAKVRR